MRKSAGTWRKNQMTTGKEIAIYSMSSGRAHEPHRPNQESIPMPPRPHSGSAAVQEAIPGEARTQTPRMLLSRLRATAPQPRTPTPQGVTPERNATAQAITSIRSHQSAAASNPDPPPYAVATAGASSAEPPRLAVASIRCHIAQRSVAAPICRPN